MSVYVCIESWVSVAACGYECMAMCIFWYMCGYLCPYLHLVVHDMCVCELRWAVAVTLLSLQLRLWYNVYGF